MDIDADVTLVDQQRLAGVDAHADADRGVCQHGLPCLSREDRVLRRAEGDEEGVSLGVDLDAGPPSEGVTKEPPVLSERLRIPFAELLEQARGALDVREEECDRAARELPRWHRLVAARSQPVGELAERDHADEDQADDQHRCDDVLALLGGRLREREHGADARAISVRGQVGVDPHTLR